MVRVLSLLQQRILELLVKKEEGLTFDEILKEVESRGVSAEDLRTCLRGMVIKDYLESPKSNQMQRWLIAHEGLRAIGAIGDYPWP